MENLDVETVKKQLKAQLAAATYQQMVEDMSEKCFNMCIKKPGTSLDNYESRCLGNCMDRFIDSYNVVTKEFTAKLSNQMNQY